MLQIRHYHIIEQMRNRLNLKVSLVSIIITTRNSAGTLQALLQSIKNQSYKNIETIVVDNNSVDGTVAIAKKFTSSVFNKGPERSMQRNFGARKSKGKYLFFLDSDMELSKGVVSECVSKFTVKLGEVKVGGLIVPEKSFGSGFWVKAKTLERKINEGQCYFEAARFFPADIFKEVGGYDENLTGPEDWELPERIAKNYIIARVKNYIYHNEGRHTLLGLARKKYYYGLSAHKYLKKHRKSPLNQRTIYLLRSAYYRNWRELLNNPLLYLGMWVMLVVETLGGGLGYVVGRFSHEK